MAHYRITESVTPAVRGGGDTGGLSPADQHGMRNTIVQPISVAFESPSRNAFYGIARTCTEIARVHFSAGT